MGFRPTLDFRNQPTVWDYMQGRNLLDVIVGPVGSGKTYGSLVKPHMLAELQEKSPNGRRRTRGIVVRNTMPELKATTMATYENLYPPDKCGRIIMRSPAEHVVRRGDVEMEILFIALDKPSDVAKLLSLETSWIYFNEVREIPRPIISRATERVGRYLINERPSTWSGIFADTNPPDRDHYLYEWDKIETPPGFKFYHQPPGVLEAEPVKGGFEIIDASFQRLKGSIVPPTVTVGGREWPIEIIRSAGRQWIVNPAAENLANLINVQPTENVMGPNGYYGRALAGKTVDEIRVYFQGVYAFVADGKPVIPEYDEQRMALDDLPILDDVKLFAGFDIGGGTLQPAAIFFQRHPRGPWLVHGEVVAEDLGVDRFGELVSSYLATHFPKHYQDRERLLGTFYGDPAGVKRDEIFQTASFDHLRNVYGFDMQAAPSQDILARINAIKSPCTRYMDGRPGLLVNRRMCPQLHKGLLGGWMYKRLQVTGGTEQYHLTPAKNQYSHPCDGLGYGLMGAGEYRSFTGRANRPNIPMTAETEFNL